MKEINLKNLPKDVTYKDVVIIGEFLGISAVYPRV